MRNWENTYVEIYQEVESLGLMQRFDEITQSMILQNKQTPIRQIWQNALEILRNHEK